jgi:putative phosphotransacetylase
MNQDEIQELAVRIARIIASEGWVPAPVRTPISRPTSGDLPVWSGAAQNLDDVAPGKHSGPANRHRPAYPAVTTAARAAAAGTGPAPFPNGGNEPASVPVQGRQVPIAVSNRHIHICKEKFEQLFGHGVAPQIDRTISQPGQFASKHKVRVVGPAGSIDGVRIVGPLRDHTQVELATSDCRRLGIKAPVRDSGSVKGSGAVKLEGPAGSVVLTQGVIVAAGHLHLSPKDAEKFGLNDGERVSVLAGQGERVATLHDFLVRSGPTHTTEVHVDTDEANALGISTGDTVTILGKPSRTRHAGGGKRKLITERDVSVLASQGEKLTDCKAYIVTPAARDRAKALGIWRD